MLRTAIYECYHKYRQGSMAHGLFVIIADEHNGFNIEHFPRFLRHSKLIRITLVFLF